MSWSVSVQGVPYHCSDNDGLIRLLRDEAVQQNPECGDQIDAAIAAAMAIVQSGSVGPPSHTFHVSMSGHSNPGHRPREGWVNDMVSISIYQEAQAQEEISEVPAAAVPPGA